MLQKGGCQSKYLKRYLPNILTCIGSAGVVLTAVMAVKATPKAMKLLKTAEDKKREDLTNLETVRAVGAVYIPAALAAVATVLCIFGANALNKRQQASLASAYALLSQSYQEYRNAAKNVYGEDADSKIQAEAAKKMYICENGNYTYDPYLDCSSEEALFYDAYSRRYFTSTMAAVINAQYHINRNFVLRGGATVNEFYEFLGIDKIDAGDIGWGDEFLESGFMWIDFRNDRVKMDDGMECYIISTIYVPEIT
jgi:hypothetical protein